MKVNSIRTSIDGSRKYTFETDRRDFVEAVYFQFRGTYRGRKIEDRVICLSTQCGCPVRCSFCETGKMAKNRNLSVEEMSSQVKLIREDLQKEGLVVANYYALMGMGEPLLNLWNIRDFYLRNREGSLGISLSSVGIIPAIDFLREDPQTDFTLYLSLHTPYDSQRNQLIPINQRYPLTKVLEAGERFAKQKGRRTILTYMLIEGVNDSVTHARDLALIVNPANFSVQITCHNSCKTNETRFRQRARLFRQELLKKGIESDVQTSKGRDIGGGCGQLAKN